MLFSGASCPYPGNSILKCCTKKKREDYQRDAHTLPAHFTNQTNYFPESTLMQSLFIGDQQ